MVSLTLSVSEELKEKMSEHPEVKWSEVVRATLEKQIREVEEAEKIASKSRLTDKDVSELSIATEKEVTKRWKDAVRN